MRPVDLITPSPLLDEVERARLNRTPRYRYALRVAGWTSRAVAVYGTLTWIGRLIAEPSARAPAAIWLFLAKMLGVVGIAGIFSFAVTAFALYPTMRRTGERSEVSSAKDDFDPPD